MAADKPRPDRKTALRGFAAMDKDRQREIARMGGASIPKEKRTFSQDRALAAEAGRKGGVANHRRRGRRPAAAGPELDS